MGAQALDAGRIINGILLGRQAGVTGISEPVTFKFVAKITEIDEGMGPLVCESGSRTTKNKLLPLVTALVCFHGIVRFGSGSKI